MLVWHPDGAHNGGRVDALTTSADLYATLLDVLDAPVPDHVHSRCFPPFLTGTRETHRDWALYGYWGSSVNVTDGRYTYFHSCDESIDAYLFWKHKTTAVYRFSHPNNVINH